MRALLIAAGVFFSICGGFLVYAALSGAGHEYDLKLVLPVDTRQMPAPASIPEVAPQADAGASDTVTQGRAEAAGLPPMPDRPPVQFGSRDGAASEVQQ